MISLISGYTYQIVVVRIDTDGMYTALVIDTPSNEESRAGISGMGSTPDKARTDALRALVDHYKED